MKTKNIGSTLLSYGFLTLISLIVIFPFYWMLITSLKPLTAVFEFPPRLFPASFGEIKWENYRDLFIEHPLYPRYFFNSLYTGGLVTIISAMTSALAGYSFAKLKFPFKNAIFIMLLSSMMIPAEVTVIPLFSWMAKLGMINTHIPLIVPPAFGLRSVFGLFMMRQFFITIPDALAESAKIDGCSPWSTFVHIMAPLSTSALATLSILTFLHRWDQLLEPLIYLNKTKLYTLPIALSLFTDMGVTEWNLLMAASVLATLPLLIVFFLAQKWFVESIALSGIK